MTDLGNKSVHFETRIWLKHDGRIAIASNDAGFISTVSNDPKSKRYHPHLFRKLAAVLRDEDVPAPKGNG
ncbi:MAG: hypothetical protein F4047_10975 [Caldilineaceae bacterium SB0670_bin_27]|nr:hypothetical protein [Gemmatimonadota bacterium]MYJ78641.1 hypothetical protein [Caldilineaceae bacterium SB0670_bin_27]